MVAFFSSAIGVGGGCILVPSLISIFKLPYAKAASLSLATIAPITLIGAMGHVFCQHEKLGMFVVYLPFILCCLIGSLIAGKFITKTRHREMKIVFSAFIAIVGMKMTGVWDLSGFLFKGSFSGEVPYLKYIVIMFGLGIGFISTLLGVGCGLVIVPFFVYVVRLDMHEAILVSLFTMAILTSTGSYVHYRFKTLDLTSVNTMLLPACLGSIVGVVVSTHMPATTLKVVFGWFLLIISIKYVVNYPSLKMGGDLENFDEN